jgi:hypothetical protein
MDNLFRGKITHRAYLGNILYLFVNIQNTLMRIQASYNIKQREGEDLFVFLNPEKCIILA